MNLEGDRGHHGAAVDALLGPDRRRARARHSDSRLGRGHRRRLARIPPSVASDAVGRPGRRGGCAPSGPRTGRDPLGVAGQIRRRDPGATRRSGRARRRSPTTRRLGAVMARICARLEPADPVVLAHVPEIGRHGPKITGRRAADGSATGRREPRAPALRSERRARPGAGARVRAQPGCRWPRGP